DDAEPDAGVGGDLHVAHERGIGGDEGRRIDLWSEALVRNDETGHQRIPEQVITNEEGRHEGALRRRFGRARSALGELEAAAGTGPAVLLALDHAAVAGQEAV